MTGVSVMAAIRGMCTFDETPDGKQIVFDRGSIGRPGQHVDRRGSVSGRVRVSNQPGAPTCYRVDCAGVITMLR